MNSKMMAQWYPYLGHGLPQHLRLCVRAVFFFRCYFVLFFLSHLSHLSIGFFCAHGLSAKLLPDANVDMKTKRWRPVSRCQASAYDL